MAQLSPIWLFRQTRNGSVSPDKNAENYFVIWDWRGVCVKENDKEVRKYFGKMEELKVFKIVLTNVEKDVNMEHRRVQVYYPIRQIQGSRTGFAYSSSADLMKNIKSQCAQSINFEGMNTAPSQTLFDETRRIVTECGELSHRVPTVCNNSSGAGK